METEFRRAILCTLAYADVFDYPLLVSEVWRFLKVQRKTDLERVQKQLKRMKTDKKQIEADKEFCFLKGRKDIIFIRKKRERWSQEKLQIARRVAKWLRLIPWIKMVAVTGALAMGNSARDDDIDLLIVTSKNRLWLTRFLVVLLIEVVAKRRRPGDKEVKDKICLNMFLDEKHLAVPKKEQDLFSAHEICQLKPLWERDGIYQKFLNENQWMRRFLPNCKEDTRIIGYYDIKRKKQRTLNILISQYHNIVFFIEQFVYRLQLAYMESRKTTEVTEPGRIRFHPKDAREWVLKEYQKRLKKLGIEPRQ